MKGNEMLTRIVEAMTEMTLQNRLEWKPKGMFLGVGNFRADRKDYALRLEGAYSRKRDKYYILKLVPKQLLKCVEKPVGFRQYHISEQNEPETFSRVSRLLNQIHLQHDAMLFNDPQLLMKY